MQTAYFEIRASSKTKKTTPNYESIIAAGLDYCYAISHFGGNAVEPIGALATRGRITMDRSEPPVLAGWPG